MSRDGRSARKGAPRRTAQIAKRGTHSTRGWGAPRVPGMDMRRMESGIREFLEAARGALKGDLRRTPARAARAWKEDLLSGYAEDPARILVPLRESASHDLIAIRDLDFISVCPHHLLPFSGKVHLAYLPDGRIVGVSRLARLVRSLSRRLQIQESLTRQITAALDEHLHPRGSACVVEATHLCMTARGRRAVQGTVVTSAFSGCYEIDARSRAEVLSLLGLARRPGARRIG